MKARAGSAFCSATAISIIIRTMISITKRAPRLWIEPIGDWSAGGVQLVEIPSVSEANDNIIGFWKPKQTLAAGSETFFAYRQFWCWNPPEQPPLAIATQSRSGRGSSSKRRRFVVEFTGDILSAPENSEALKPNLSVAPGSIVAASNIYLDGQRNPAGCCLKSILVTKPTAKCASCWRREANPLARLGFTDGRSEQS